MSAPIIFATILEEDTIKRYLLLPFISIIPRIELTLYVFIGFKFSISEKSFTVYILSNDFSIAIKDIFFVFSI